MDGSRVVSPNEWLAARRELLERERELSRLRNEVSAQRRNLPRVRVNKPYVFEGPNGKETLAGLFGKRRQLIIYHFMFGPGWKEGCVGCSFLADHIDGARVHIEHRDISLVAVARAPLPQIEAFKERMGWRFKWVSSFGSDFNYDYHVSFTRDDMIMGYVYYDYEVREFTSEDLPGVSVFYKDDNGGIFHTYSAYGRDAESLCGAYSYIDLTPLGRQEEEGHWQAWVRHHDRYVD
ncbi:MAG TPA: thioredoxin family protein [Vineibacter sp.]|nr:thioredoxin family protein [Vineibacter sp.]